MDWRHLPQAMWRSLLDFLFPPRCLLCQCSHTAQTPLLCDACRTDLPWIDHACRQCALPLSDAAAELCGQCLRQAPSFTRALAPLAYQAPVSGLIGDFKYRNALHTGALLSDLLAENIEQSEQSQPDLLLPVPLHWRRRLRRGYNQSELLAHRLGRRLDIRIDTHLLKRVRRTPPQQGLNRRQRQRNLRRAFKVTRALNGETIALIDDVITTCASADEIARCLLKAGAGEVQVWALARTPKACTE